MLDAFEKLLNNLARDLELAHRLSSPNTEDTDEIKVAIVGFSYHSTTEQWSTSEFQFVARILESTEDFSPRERLFYALGLGYLLGLLQSGKLSRDSFDTAIAQLPGFIFLNAGAF
jgi:hypothetical protein